MQGLFFYYKSGLSVASNVLSRYETSVENKIASEAGTLDVNKTTLLSTSSRPSWKPRKGSVKDTAHNVTCSTYMSYKHVECSSGFSLARPKQRPAMILLKVCFPICTVYDSLIDGFLYQRT